MNGKSDLDIVCRLFTGVWGDPNGVVPDGLVHEDYWSSEPSLAGLGIAPDGMLEARITGIEALTKEIALYRDRLSDFTLTMKEVFPVASTVAARDVAMWEERRLVGDVVVVSWTAGATHPTATITTRGGQQIAARVGGEGVSVVRIVDGRIHSANKYWEGDGILPEIGG
ncbi:hypothetical protein [Sphaerisporangium perillae]|uniref:hypothetical protein n=1 Tax=Sphaerisporangium perillae TaxID=2935860 RepID=UPI00200C9E42|nr:hypothetical protein [Sphaerisporangium perillae]